MFTHTDEFMVRKWWFCIFTAFLVAGLGADNEVVQDSGDVPYCFRLTWVGPGYDNNTEKTLNTTCNDEDMKKLFPTCKDPLVVTDDGTYPNFTYLWESYQHNKLRIACPLSEGFVCAKWTSYFEDVVEYTMHLCSKITIEKEGAMTSGCLKSIANNSRTTEVCACRSYKGSMPCNSAVQNTCSLFLLLLILPLLANQLAVNFHRMRIC